MLRAYGPNCDGSVIDPAKGQRIPDDATWIDLEEPTREEDKLVEHCVGVQVPTREDMAEIEPSSRLYEENGALYMTLTALVRGGGRQSEERSDRLRADRRPAGHRPLRHARSRSARSRSHARRDKALVQDNLTALYSPARCDHRPAGRRARRRRRRDRDDFGPHLPEADRCPAHSRRSPDRASDEDRPHPDPARQRSARPPSALLAC